MTKADIIDNVQESLGGHNRKDAADLVESVFELIKAELEKGANVKISGFGNFMVRSKRARIGRNPRTGQEIEITARRVLTFRASNVLKAQINGKIRSNGKG